MDSLLNIPDANIALGSTLSPALLPTTFAQSALFRDMVQLDL